MKKHSSQPAFSFLAKELWHCDIVSDSLKNKMLSYRRETTLQGNLVFAKSRTLELGDNDLRTL